MHDRPTAAELLDAVRRFLEAELLPALSDARQRFQTLIAANVLSVAGRELAAEEEHADEEWRLLGEVGTPPARREERRQALERGNRALCERIRAGAFDEPERFRELARKLRPLVARKLQVANPRFLEASSSR